MFKRLPWRRATFVALALVVAIMMMTSTAFAAKGGNGGGKGGGQGGGGKGGGEETATNNLSVPAVFVGANPFGLTCPSGPTDPADDAVPLTNYPVDGDAYFYVQGIHKWQAQCVNGTTGAPVTGAWGDNLAGGEASLKVNSPVRVEMGLIDASGTSMVGYIVEKLDPNALDRESAYGTRAQVDTTHASGFAAIQTTYPYQTIDPETGLDVTVGYRVWTAGATLAIYHADATGNPTGTPVVSTSASAEINATGAVVYGYNWRPTAAGDYVIQFTAPNVSIQGTNAGTVSGQTFSIVVSVAANAGGGGGGGRP